MNANLNIPIIYSRDNTIKEPASASQASRWFRYSICVNYILTDSDIPSALKHQFVGLIDFVFAHRVSHVRVYLSVTSACKPCNTRVLACTRSTGTCGSGLLVPINTGVPAKSPL